MSDFMEILHELCRLPGALGAVFVDYEGECIQQVTVDAGLSAYDLSVVGAHAAPILGSMKLCSMRLVGDEGITFIREVKDQYAVVLVARPDAMASRITWALERAAKQLLLLM